MATLRLDVSGRLDEEAPSREHKHHNRNVDEAERECVFTLEPEPSSSPGHIYTDLSCFRDLTTLHQGRHSTVWSAVCKRTGRTCVIKGYNRDSLKPRQLNNVRREIGLLRFFRDTGTKGVVALLAAFEDKTMIYLVFEACMRGDLYQLLMRNRGTLHEEFVVTKIVFPLLCVLQQLHKLHIVHRDIKPENIFITEDGEIALGDFGLAGHKFQDRMTERVGTLDYMAPEVLSIPANEDADTQSAPSPSDGAKTYDEKVDIWATGVLVYELLVGRPPFEVDDPQETARLIMSGSASGYPVHISQYARDFVAQALTKLPGARPTAEDLLQHSWLRHYFGGKVPDTAAQCGSTVTAGLLKSWLVASWSDISKAGTALKPNSVVPNRLFLSPASSPRKALSTGDGPNSVGHLDHDVKPAPHYKRKSVPGCSDAGCESPHDRELRKQYGSADAEGSVGPSGADADANDAPHPARSGSSSLDRQLQMSLESSEPGLEAGGSDPSTAPNRLTASQYPSRDSSAGSMDQAVPQERTYVRNDSGASASSSISVASFASLQHVPRTGSVNELAESEDLGLVQRSASVCAANMGRPPAGFPAGNTSLKPVWQAQQTSTTVGANRKTPGKSRFAA
ncbi:hypothetical protein CHLRE_03g184450v5 [Chlamydomonas reinhardtii]|uniref:Protein kinase domain-containing protein n=1 Tax=Chlamydomonas reinhardtii TaxID=3055 RepID=A0A2K3DXY4_CHLRE|nr:uncharacterized protein CHLRE_03g184450v5 [Chlamydomonas reinhardtii]PNW85396.1 hypothetical protein CHLRE_03g184450v5 [Chlamydomonas reinhardtii]